MDFTFVVKVAAIGMIMAVLNQVLTKSGRDEYALLTVITGLVVVLAMLIPHFETLYALLSDVFD